jgi:hypothetical protein
VSVGSVRIFLRSVDSILSIANRNAKKRQDIICGAEKKLKFTFE